MSVRKHRKIGGRYHWSNCLLFDYEFLLRWMTAGYSSLTVFGEISMSRGKPDYPLRAIFPILSPFLPKINREQKTQEIPLLNSIRIYT